MKLQKFFILIFIFLFIRCSETQPIVNSVCSITEEICYYAHLVCENFNDQTLSKEKSTSIKTELQIVSDELKKEYLFIQQKKSAKNFESDFNLKYRLMQIRNDLKNIFDEQQKNK